MSHTINAQNPARTRHQRVHLTKPYYDLGTAVLAPDCGYYQQQHPCLSYHTDRDGPDPDSLQAGVLRAYAERPGWRADPDRRLAEQRHVAAVQDSVYRELVP